MLQNNALLTGWRPRRLALVVACAAAVSACAPLPPQRDAAQMKTAADFATSATFAAPAVAWPADHWWQAYGDAQLNVLVDEALQASPDLATARARLDSAEAAGVVAGAALKPQVSANGSLSDQKLSSNYLTPKAFTPSGTHGYGQATLDLSWELDFWGKNRAALAAATSEQEARRAELAQSRLVLAASVADAYNELARLYAAADTAQAMVTVRDTTAKLFAQRYANGMETLGSVRQADARLAQAQGQLVQMQESLALQRNRLAALLGAGPDRGLRIARPTLNFARGYGLPSALAADLLGRRPDVVAARLLAQAQASRVDAQQAAFYPNVNLSAMVGAQSLGIGMLTKPGSSMASVGPAISLPLFNGGRLKGQLRGAQAAYDEAVASYNGTLTRALQDVADNAASRQALDARLQRAQEAVLAVRDAHRIVRERYQGGLATHLDVLTVEDTLLDSLTALTDLQSRSVTLDVALNRALGGGYQAAL
ncbi:efflux transporter outer membrane subunit [Duganella guangzhouensis]|nr:efflux transporter outer membrane subunit [Duganella guangzhouensis]